MQLDQEWRDHFAQSNIPLRGSAEEEEKRQFMFDSLVASTSLQEMLLEQVRESSLKEEDWPIAEMLIGNIDDYGYLKASIEELVGTTGVALERVEHVLRVVQSFDPAGVGARDLRECLMLQLERAGQKDSLEYRIVSEFMEALGKRRIPEIPSPVCPHGSAPARAPHQARPPRPKPGERECRTAHGSEPTVPPTAAGGRLRARLKGAGCGTPPPAAAASPSAHRR